MKRCPECRRDFYDDSLLYCLDDGSVLLDGPGSQDPRTLVIPQVSAGFHPSSSPVLDFPTQVLTSQQSLVPPPNSIAVLPFVNIGSDPDLEYFSDGLAEELLNVLSKIRGLRVAARTSSFTFKDKSTTVTEIGRALNVGSVVEGSIRMSGGRMRIAVQLIKVEDGYQIWSETYDRVIDDIFAVQDDIARCVVGELRSLLLGDEPPSDFGEKVIEEVAEATRGRSADPEAQRLMLLGRYFLDRTTRDDAVNAVKHLSEAVKLDPDFALGWAELGRTYAVQAGKSWMPLEEGFRKAREAAERALALEPNLAEAYALLGRIRAAYDWDLSGARAAYSRALELAPGSSLVMDGASVLEAKFGHFDRALELIRQILAQDPLSSAVWHNLGLFCHFSGALSEAERAYRRARDLSPQRLVSTAMLALVLEEEGRTRDAVEAVEGEPDPFWRLWASAMLYYRIGETERADDLLAEILRDHADGDAYQIAEIYADRGEVDEAFRWLDRAIAERDPGVTHLRASPRFRSLHADPRWPSFLIRLGFDDVE
jgi:TolB-like protein/cytochrome c-type biogenesis protein CcmH/NrfG